MKEHKRQLSDSTAAVQKSEKVVENGGGGLEPFDAITGGAPPIPSATEVAISPNGGSSGGGGGGQDEPEGRGSGRSPGTEYESTRRLM